MYVFLWKTTICVQREFPAMNEKCRGRCRGHGVRFGAFKHLLEVHGYYCQYVGSYVPHLNGTLIQVNLENSMAN